MDTAFNSFVHELCCRCRHKCLVACLRPNQKSACPWKPAGLGFSMPRLWWLCLFPDAAPHAEGGRPRYPRRQITDIGSGFMIPRLSVETVIKEEEISSGLNSLTNKRTSSLASILHRHMTSIDHVMKISGDQWKETSRRPCKKKLQIEHLKICPDLSIYSSARLSVHLSAQSSAQSSGFYGCINETE